MLEQPTSSVFHFYITTRVCIFLSVRPEIMHKKQLFLLQYDENIFIQNY